MSTYKLIYGNGRGRAEVSRLIFAVAGQQYEDIRYERDEWPAHKAEMPLGQVPVLEFDGVQLPQSLSIARFLAKQFQLAGRDNFEQAKVDTVADTINETFKKYAQVFLEKDETNKQELTKKFFAEELPKDLQNLEVLHKLYGDGGPFFVGNQLTWADLLVYNTLQYFIEIDATCLDNFPWLKENRAEVEKQPRIAEYLKNRPKTDY